MDKPHRRQLSSRWNNSHQKPVRVRGNADHEKYSRAICNRTVLAGVGLLLFISGITVRQSLPCRYRFWERLTTLCPQPSTPPPPARQWWKELEACAGPRKEYMLGTNTTVLQYTRWGRGVLDPPLEEVVQRVWEWKRAEGLFRFPVVELEHRHAEAGRFGWECDLVSNPGREKPFPLPQPPELPFSSESFNFYKARPSDFMFSYKPNFRARVELEETPLKVDAGTSRMEREVLSCEEVGGEESRMPSDVVLINVRPIGPGSILFIPSYPSSMPQRATAETLAVALDFAEGLETSSPPSSSPRPLRMGYNGMGSSASVNHLHFQGWTFDSSPTGFLPIELAETRLLATLACAAPPPSDLPVVRGERLGNPPPKMSKSGGEGRGNFWRKQSSLRSRGSDEVKDVLEMEGGEASNLREEMEVHALVGYPIRGLVYHVSRHDLQEVGAIIAACVDHLVARGTTHTMLLSTGRVFVLPRKPLKPLPFSAVPGFPELSGEVILTKVDDMNTVNADDVYQAWSEGISVEEEDFQDIVRHCLL